MLRRRRRLCSQDTFPSGAIYQPGKEPSQVNAPTSVEFILSQKGIYVFRQVTKSLQEFRMLEERC